MKFKKDDRVRLLTDCRQLHLPEPLTPRKGETGRVARLYRVQDGLEIYQVWLDRADPAFMAATHLQMELIQ